ncbi:MULTISPECIES: ABC transporter ATP-binding protein [unclassified Spirosoma]|mgnify:FL=1|uniref:ABC transporter ATP-binding protein n=1 Tax=unclassified Spirosoma TaxID=2621999 RepID=UPI00095B5E46|nr:MULTISPECIES: ATP-binding cassette domain-containing protein [unclassified Spirosoma]MBN8826510.1 ATP-binding cassette domain-containing protein [Spirosoma sp.]OJW76399.1 MAG: ABC transporter ATP-binding protein [Spirosoma sp. 48-14]
MTNILETHHIIKQYAEHRALDDVSLSVPKGCIFGLLGPNGAGKTSLIRIINQITAPDSGEVILDGERLKPDHIKRIGYLPEERGLYKKMKVGEQLLYLAQLKGLTEKQAMEMLKVWFVKFDIKTWWNKQIQDLSKGMQQKVQFVATVLHEPDLIILDEPFSGFDPINANLIKDEILELREKGKTIIFSTHRMESVEELCDYIALINRSHKILDGSKRAIKEQFKTHTYHIEYQGVLTSLPTAFEVLRNQPLEDDFQRADIKIPPDASVNDLIRHLIDTVALRSFGENIPSMNDIFIQTVGENND